MARFFTLIILVSAVALLTANNVVMANADANRARFLRTTDTDEERGTLSRITDKLATVVHHEETKKFIGELQTISKQAKVSKQYGDALLKIDEIEAKVKLMTGMDKAMENVEKTRFHIWYKMGKVPENVKDSLTRLEFLKYDAYFKATKLAKLQKKDGKGTAVAATGGWAVGGI